MITFCLSNGQRGREGRKRGRNEGAERRREEGRGGYSKKRGKEKRGEEGREEGKGENFDWGEERRKRKVSKSKRGGIFKETG